jgi:hypothetical protein
MTGFIVSVLPFRNRVSSKEAFEGLELGEGKPSRPVLRGPGGRKAAWLLGSNNRREGVPQNALRAGIRQYVFLRHVFLRYLDKVLPCGLGCG